MAAANLLRNKLKTILVVLSLALSITMLNGAYGFTRGFSMDGFLSKFVISDFLVADANYFNYSGWGNVSQTLVESLKSQEGYEEGGYVKAYTGALQTGLTKEKWMYWMKGYQRFTEEEIDEEIVGLPADAPMEIYTDILVLDDYTIQHLEVIEGSLEKWKEPEMGYESRGKYSANYQQFQSTFWIVGGSLSFIIGLVGVLNFINGEVTTIISRRRELAMLQSIGMTGKQMKQMLILEGVLTVGMALILAALLNLGVFFGIMPVIENLFWYFKQNFTMAMILAAFPVLLLLGTGIPALVYRQAAKKSIVERLRESDM